MIGANAAALEENGRRLSEGRGVYDEVKGLEVRVAQSKEAYAMYDENLSVMSQVSYLLSGLFPIIYGTHYELEGYEVEGSVLKKCHFNRTTSVLI